MSHVRLGGRETSLMARFMGPTWGPPGAGKTHMGPMLAPWTLLSGLFYFTGYLIQSAPFTSNLTVFLEKKFAVAFITFYIDMIYMCIYVCTSSMCRCMITYKINVISYLLALTKWYPWPVSQGIYEHFVKLLSKFCITPCSSYIKQMI